MNRQISNIAPMTSPDHTNTPEPTTTESIDDLDRSLAYDRACALDYAPLLPSCMGWSLARTIEPSSEHTHLTNDNQPEHITRIDFNVYDTEPEHITRIDFNVYDTEPEHITRIDFNVYDTIPTEYAIIDPNIFNQSRTERSVYDNKHNVHATSVATTVTKSIQNLMLDPEPDSSSVLEQILYSELSDSTKTSLTLFCMDRTLHVLTGLQYVDVLAYVWQRIQNPLIELCMYDTDDEGTIRTELMRILEERVSDCIDRTGSTVCFGGRLSRLVSTLDGFFTDIRITISDTERITAIVLQAGASMRCYDSATHASIATERLLEAGFEPDQFKAWITTIEENTESCQFSAWNDDDYDSRMDEVE